MTYGSANAHQMTASLGSKPASQSPQTQPSAAQTPTDLNSLLLQAPRFFIHQKKSWLQILTDFEASNKYTILTEQNNPAGSIVEQSKGFLAFIKRIFLRSHRPFHFVVADVNGQTVLQFKRKFFFFFSDIDVLTPDGTKLGSAHRRFGILRKKYDLRDATGQNFARINTFFFRIWTFKILDAQGNERAVITKKWGGIGREMFTDADRFLVDYGQQAWRAHERAVIFGVAMSIDFDFFERNGGGVSRFFNNG